MGWTTQNRGKGTTDREFFQDLMGTKYTIIDCATVGRAVFYAAVRTNEGDEAGQVWAFVALISWTGGYYNFGYKDMDERMGPNEASCPTRVLDKLTELPGCEKRPHKQHDYCGLCAALEWRADCRKLADRRARAAKVKAGQVVKFARPVKFQSGAELDTLTFDKRDVFTADGSRYKVTGWRAMDWELVPA
jgi:hypothetical protein